MDLERKENGENFRWLERGKIIDKVYYMEKNFLILIK